MPIDADTILTIWSFLSIIIMVAFADIAVKEAIKLFRNPE